MAKLTLNDITSLANTASAKQALNDNFTAIEAAIEKTLSRDGAAPNQMTADIDLNNNDLLNVKRIDADEIFKNGVPFEQTVAYGEKVFQLFSGNGSQTTFPLSTDPGSLGNLLVSISGVVQVPGIDYNYTGTALTFSVAPAAGSNNIFVGYDIALATGVTNASAVSFLQSGTGAVVRTSQEKARDFISGSDFGIAANGIADDTVALTNAITEARVRDCPLFLPKGTIKTTSTIDISGVTLVGVPGGYRNIDGTVIQGAGTHDVLSQLTASVPGDTQMNLSNLRIKGGLWGIKTRYMLHSTWQNVHVTDCATGGIQFGNSSDSGGLFNTFTNVEVDVTGTGIDINGNGFVNANKFNQCFFRGTLFGGKLRCTGGIGASDNVFSCSEFLGDRFGLEMDNTSNTVFNGCYFESKGPSLHMVGTRNIGWAVNNSVFAVLENTNPTGKNTFIYHAGVGTSSGTVSGGYIFITAGAIYNGLSFVASENPTTFFLSMLDPPEQDISASGFILLNNLTSANLNINQTGSFTPTWTATGSNPALGNGTITGQYVRAGNMVTSIVTLLAGTTTTYGTGDYLFSLPFPAQAKSVGSAFIVDAGTAFHDGMPVVEAGGSTVAVYRQGGATLVGPTVPMTWATGDGITITITYRA